MAGSGDLFNRAIRRVANWGFHFHFTGFFARRRVKNMFAYSDVYVRRPSVSEPFGISPLEAMKANRAHYHFKAIRGAEVLRHIRRGFQMSMLPQTPYTGC